MLIDLHAHPGRFFLDGLPTGAPAQAMRQLGGEASDLADAAAAGMTVVSVATISDLAGIGLDPAGGLMPRGSVTDEDLYADHLRQLDAARAAIAAAGLSPFLRAAELVAATETGGPLALIACEGADFVGTELGRIGQAHERGVRSVQLVHYCPNPFGDLQTQPAQHGGLSERGAAVVRELNRLGMLVDLAHASEATTRDAVRISDAPVMISHTHLNGTAHDHPRMVGPAHARLVADAGGVIGVWPSGFSSRTFGDFVGEVVRLVDAVGVDHVGIGTDMDGNYKPVMTGFEQFAQLREALRDRGFNPDEVDAVVGGNAARLLAAVCR